MGSRKEELEGLLSQFPHIRTTVQEEVWRLEGNSLTAEWQQLFFLLDRTSVKALWIYRSQQPTIIRQLIHIQFDNLEELHLGNNSIKSVECISWLRAPHLQTLSLDHNNLTRVRPLSKCQLPHLKTLYLYGNPLIDAESIVQMQAEIENLYLQFFVHGGVMKDDLAWVSKLSPLKLLGIKALKRIRRGMLTEQLKVKSSELKVYQTSS